MLHPGNFVFFVFGHTLQIFSVADNDDESENQHCSFQSDGIEAKEYVNACRNGRADACQSDDFAEVEYQQENNHRQSKNQRGIGSEYNQAEKEAVHGSNRFTAAEVCENRVAMADCCSKTAADGRKLCADEMLCKKDNQSYFKQALLSCLLTC